jgi:hypothetical protein
MSDTTDFGSSKDFGAHHFYVDIPAKPKVAVSIYEDYGFDGDETRRETTELRVVLARELWTKIKDRRESRTTQQSVCFYAANSKADTTPDTWYRNTNTDECPRALGPSQNIKQRS